MNRNADRSERRAVRIRCDCGEWLEADAEAHRVDCECGKVFAVTVTDMGSVPAVETN